MTRPARRGQKALRARRVRLLTAVVIVGLAGLAGRAAFLGTVQAGDLSARAEDQRRVEREVPASRGPIVTRDGTEIAAGRPAGFVTATPYQVEDPVEAARLLGPLLGRTPENVANQLRARSGYEVLHRALDPAKAGKIEGLGIDGIQVTDIEERYYPKRRVAGQLVGLTGEGGAGISGLEKQVDKALTGRPGRRVELQDPFRRPVRVLVDEEPVPGKPVRLTLDANIQERVEHVLAVTRKRYEAVSASAIVMRPSDGAIYAMATVPRFDPNDRTKLTDEVVRNRPVTDTFEPGSTFKLATIAGALEEELVTPGTEFDLPTRLTKFADTEFETTLKDAHDRPPVRWSVAEILKYSSNIGTVKVAEELSRADKLQAWIERFGFGKATGVDFPGEVQGIMVPAEKWSGVSILNVPIGQGIGTTLLQMARAYAAPANGGKLVTPFMVSRVGDVPTKRPDPTRIMSTRTARQLTEMLKGVVQPDGTGALAGVEGYEVAGKTGTSNKIAEDGTYDTTRYWASFIGYLPARKPQLLVAVLVDEPGGGAIYGGEVAAPAFEEISEFSLGYLGIGP